MTRLGRYRATWSDGVTRVIHASTRLGAHSLALQLGVPTGVWLCAVEQLP